MTVKVGDLCTSEFSLPLLTDLDSRGNANNFGYFVPHTPAIFLGVLKGSWKDWARVLTSAGVCLVVHKYLDTL